MTTATAASRVAAVLTAYRRERYLPYALASVAEQVVPVDSVHVASDFDPNANATGPGKNPVGWSRVTSAAQGPKIGALVRATEGADLLAFLDDDDLWSPEKIATVRPSFLQYPDLAFLNHAHTEFFDGVRAERPLWKRLRDLRGGFVRFGDFHYYGNSSCMVVRRAALLPYLDVIERIDLAGDDALFWLAGMEGRARSLRTPLSRVRVHRENSSRTSALMELRSLAERRYASYRTLDPVVRGRYRAAFEAKLDRIRQARDRAALAEEAR